jgi:hypothetical protein
MAQSVNLSVSGVYTSGNDMNGLPQGALDAAVNCESRFKNTLEPRRGFEALIDSAIVATKLVRLINFIINGTDRILTLTDDGDVFYYSVSGIPSPWLAVPGNSTGIVAPDSVNGKSRFVRGGQNLYLTSQDGVRSLSSGASAKMIRAGVPKALNLQAETNGDIGGFFDNNVQLATSGDVTSGGAIITNLSSTTGVTENMYVSGVEIAATLVVQDLTYTSELFGVLGNAITIAYTTGGTAGAEVVTVVGNAISVKIQSGVSTANQIKTAVLASSAAIALVDVTVSGTGSNTQTAPTGPTHLAGGVDNTIPSGTRVLSITLEATVIVQTGNTTAGSVTIGNLTSNAGIIAGLLVSGQGIPEGSKVVSITGAGPYSVDIDLPAYQTDTGTPITFTSPVEITMDQNATATAQSTTINFYSGAQVAYRMLFGRVETDANNGKITRVGAPSPIAIVTNTGPYSTNVTVMGTLPKNASNELTFVQLFRSEQTDSIDITPLDQYNLVFERLLTPSDFTNRIITITDSTPDSLKGIPLYAGSDREGILQANEPPPMCWDMCTFRDFALYANATQPTTLKFTVVSVGSPNGVQIGDGITISGEFLGDPYTETYTGAASENLVSRQFAIVTTGTPSQNITDTVNSLIRVINYDQSLPVHAILLSSSTDLPGQVLLEADNPSFDTFEITASLHQDAYDPELDEVESTVNTVNNGIYASKSGEIEAVPGTNLFFAGDTSSDILRIVPLRDYVVVLKTDGVYKIQGLTPNSLICNPFDLTTKIIGAETAVPLNSSVWMLSNQGVVSISDGGVDAKSIPIDDQLDLLINSYYDNLINVAFAIGYESDRKYILSVPEITNPFTEVQHVYNYTTNCWTSWRRDLQYGFVHSNEGKLYISIAGIANESVSRERKSGSYRDYVDEALDREIVDINDKVITLDSVINVEEGDVLYLSNSVFSPILSVDTNTNEVTVRTAVGWELGPVEVLQAYECEITWKQVFGDNPAFVRQFSEGLALFKNTRFNEATLSFSTDFSSSLASTTIAGAGNGLWGIFPWGQIPWGGVNFPENLRFIIPQDKQIGSYLIPTMTIKQGFSNFKFQGLSISYYAVSQEVGL